MDVQFRRVVEQVCANWSALQLAVEHGMAGPNSKEVANNLVDYVTRLCVTEPHVGEEDIEDAFADALDQDFSTICEDDSPREISRVLHKFLRYLKESKHEEFEIELAKLPTNTWLGRNATRTNVGRAAEDSSESDESMDDEAGGADEEPGWTTVKGRRK